MDLQIIYAKKQQVKKQTMYFHVLQDKIKQNFKFFLEKKHHWHFYNKILLDVKSWNLKIING